MKGLLAVLLIAVLLLSGCAKEIVIPSSLDSMEVVEKIYPENPMRFILGNYYEYGAQHMAKGACEEGFVGGYSEPFYGEWYVKRDGRPINQSEYSILIFKVLKYESTEFAQRSYGGIGEACGLHNLTHRNIALKTAVQPVSEYGGESLWGVANLSFYVVHSGCFIIYFYGRDDVAQDALDRTIDTFGV